MWLTRSFSLSICLSFCYNQFIISSSLTFSSLSLLFSLPSNLTFERIARSLRKPNASSSYLFSSFFLFRTDNQSTTDLWLFCCPTTMSGFREISKDSINQWKIEDNRIWRRRRKEKKLDSLRIFPPFCPTMSAIEMWRIYQHKTVVSAQCSNQIKLNSLTRHSYHAMQSRMLARVCPSRNCLNKMDLLSVRWAGEQSDSQSFSRDLFKERPLKTCCAVDFEAKDAWNIYCCLLLLLPSFLPSLSPPLRLRQRMRKWHYTKAKR